jgi:hypothetical protein
MHTLTLQQRTCTLNLQHARLSEPTQDQHKVYPKALAAALITSVTPQCQHSLSTACLMTLIALVSVQGSIWMQTQTLVSQAAAML